MASPTSLRKAGLPIVRRTGSAQAAVAQTSAAVTGTIGAALATTAVTQTTPYGFATQAQGDLITTRLNQALVDIAALTAQLNLAIAENTANQTLINELRTTLVNARLMKGSA